MFKIFLIMEGKIPRQHLWPTVGVSTARDSDKCSVRRINKGMLSRLGFSEVGSYVHHFTASLSIT